MNRHQLFRYEMFLRVREFANAHPELFPASSPAYESLVALTEALERIKTHTTAATLTAGEGRKTKRVLRDAIVDRLTDIARTSRELTTGNVDTAFKLPRPGSDAHLLATVQAFIRDCQALKDEFVALGLPGNFDVELQQLADRFEQVAGGRRAGRARTKTATLALRASMDDAYRAVRRLDVIVANRLKHDPVLLAVWKGERRVALRAAGSAAAARPAPAPPVGPVNTPAHAAEAGDEASVGGTGSTPAGIVPMPTPNTERVQKAS